jgi:hypothetical protein
MKTDSREWLLAFNASPAAASTPFTFTRGRVGDGVENHFNCSAGRLETVIYHVCRGSLIHPGTDKCRRLSLYNFH